MSLKQSLLSMAVWVTANLFINYSYLYALFD